MKKIFITLLILIIVLSVTPTLVKANVIDDIIDFFTFTELEITKENDNVTKLKDGSEIITSKDNKSLIYKKENFTYFDVQTTSKYEFISDTEWIHKTSGVITHTCGEAGCHIKDLFLICNNAMESVKNGFTRTNTFRCIDYTPKNLSGEFVEDLANITIDGNGTFLITHGPGYDPTLLFLNVSDYPSFKDNVNCQPFPFCYAELNDTIGLYVPMDINITPPIDWTGNHIFATIGTGAQNYTLSGYYGGAIDFDSGGSPEYETLTEPLAGKTFVTMSMWINYTGVLAGDNFMDQQGGGDDVFVMEIKSGQNRLRVQVFDDASGVATVDAMPSGHVASTDWHHIAWTYNGQVMKLWHDGEFIGESTGASGPIEATPGSGTDFSIGANGAPRRILDEIIIFDTNLSEAQIVLLNNSRFAKILTPSIQSFLAQNITQNGTINRLNITTNTSQVNGSLLQARLKEWNESYYEDSINGDQDDSIIVWYHMDLITAQGENLTHVFDWSGNGNNATAQNGGNHTSDGKFAGAIFFEEREEKMLNLSDNIIFNQLGEITIASWVKRADLRANVNPILVQGRTSIDYSLYLSQTLGDAYSFGVNISNTQLTATSGGFEDLDWHFVVGRYNGSDVIITVDGVHTVGSTTLAGSLFASDDAINVGGDKRGDEPQGFNGTIDELIIFNRSLTDSEVEELWNIGKLRYTTPDIWQDITPGDEVVTNFSLNTDTEYFLLQFNYSHPSNFYPARLTGNIDIEYFATPSIDVIAPIITNLRNTTTTNQSSDVNWTVDEEANYTILLYNATGRIADGLQFTVYNTSFVTGNLGQNFSALLNFTEYLINLTVCDSLGNCAFNNTFNFTTAQTIPIAADSCTYPGSGDHIYQCSDNCVISISTDFLGNDWTATGTGTITGLGNLFNYESGTVINSCSADK